MSEKLSTAERLIAQEHVISTKKPYRAIQRAKKLAEKQLEPIRDILQSIDEEIYESMTPSDKIAAVNRILPKLGAQIIFLQQVLVNLHADLKKFEEESK